MSVIHVQADDALARLEFSRTRLLEAAPDLSADRLLRRHQRVVLLAIAVVLLLCLALATLGTLIVLVALCTLAYFSTVVHRVAMTVLSRRTDSILQVTDEDARAFPVDALPVYTVLVPAYREPEVIDRLLTNLGRLEYPAAKLDLKLLLEADDDETVDRALRHPLADDIDIVLVPPGEPRTKPKALNYGLTLARGELVTIYDAEDEPDPLQLRRAAVAFHRSDDDVACLQAQLTYRNPDQNIITRWFTIEYLMWFTLFLPGLSITNAPIPLGGTSNHIRRGVLEGLGGWDPYNVTEDADLGVRLHRVGWRCAVLGSVTYEEANSDFVNWMKQRSRWYKGYLQTWLVHLRHPVRLWRELGTNGFLQFNLFVGGTPLLALLNPVFWALTILWFLGKFGFIQDLFPAPVYYAGVSCWAVGNLSVAYITILAARRSERPSLVLAALFVPIYWVMMSLSAIKAGIQLVAAPNFWEKTAHGLDGPSPAPPPGVVVDDAPRAAVAVVTAAAHAPAGAGAPAVVVAEARSTTTSVHLESAARVLRGAGLVALALVIWLVAGTALVARHGAGARHDVAVHTDLPTRVAIGDPVAAVDLGRGKALTVIEGTGSRSLDHGVGHAPASVLPGGDGNAVVFGHHRTADRPFAELGAVGVGDRIGVDTRWGQVTYRVRSVRTVGGDSLDLQPEGTPRLTLVTSAGSGRWTQVRADLVGRPLRDLPEPKPGYPALPDADLVALLVAALWGALAVLAGRSTPVLARRWGASAARLAVAPVVLAGVVLAFVAIGHALPGTF